MTIGPARSIALSGLLHQQRRLEASASNVANTNTDGYRSLRVEGRAEEQGGVSSHLSRAEAASTEDQLSDVDIATEGVSRISASTSFKANLAVLATADELDRALLDIKG
jgi:flagellar hook protein FlgE